VVQGQPGPTRTFTVINTGAATLTLGAVSTPVGFTLVEGPPTSLAPGAQGTFTVRLESAAAGIKSGDIRFANNDGNENPYNFRITGRVLIGAEVLVLGNSRSIADGDTTPSATDHTSFGSAMQGGAGISRTFTVRNTGGAPLVLGAVTVPSGFTLTEGLSGSLAPGAQDTFTVRLNTATPGTFTGDVSFSTNDSDENLFEFRITGTVLGAPEITVLGNGISIGDGDATPETADGTDFGSTIRGGPALTRTFTVRNDGVATLTLGFVSVPGGFTLTEGLSTSLAPGASDTFTVQLNSTMTGVRSGDTTFINNDGSESPFNFRVTGIVLAPPEITVLGNGISIYDGDAIPSAADHTDFGGVFQGGATITRTFTVRNDGGSTLTLGAVNVPAGFTLIEGLPPSLAPGASGTFLVRLDAATVGLLVGDITVPNSDPNENPFNFRIIARVLAPLA
jgi:hypothetical protein